MTKPATAAQHDAPPHGLWFMGAHVRIHLGRSDSAAGVSMIEHRMAEGFNIPLHRHEEDETFFILEGTFRFRVGDTLCERGAGQSVHVPAGVIHAFRVASRSGRFLTVTTGGFEDMIRALAQPALAETLPPQTSMTADETDRLVALCAAHGITFVGPPID